MFTVFLTARSAPFSASLSCSGARDRRSPHSSASDAASAAAPMPHQSHKKAWLSRTSTRAPSPMGTRTRPSLWSPPNRAADTKDRSVDQNARPASSKATIATMLTRRSSPSPIPLGLPANQVTSDTQHTQSFASEHSKISIFVVKF